MPATVPVLPRHAHLPARSAGTEKARAGNTGDHTASGALQHVYLPISTSRFRAAFSTSFYLLLPVLGHYTALHDLNTRLNTRTGLHKHTLDMYFDRLSAFPHIHRHLCLATTPHFTWFPTTPFLFTFPGLPSPFCPLLSPPSRATTPYYHTSPLLLLPPLLQGYRTAFTCRFLRLRTPLPARHTALPAATALSAHALPPHAPLTHCHYLLLPMLSAASPLSFLLPHRLTPYCCRYSLHLCISAARACYLPLIPASHAAPRRLLHALCRYALRTPRLATFFCASRTCARASRATAVASALHISSFIMACRLPLPPRCALLSAIPLFWCARISRGAAGMAATKAGGGSIPAASLLLLCRQLRKRARWRAPPPAPLAAPHIVRARPTSFSSLPYL